MRTISIPARVLVRGGGIAALAGGCGWTLAAIQARHGVDGDRGRRPSPTPIAPPQVAPDHA